MPQRELNCVSSFETNHTNMTGGTTTLHSYCFSVRVEGRPATCILAKEYIIFEANCTIYQGCHKYGFTLSVFFNFEMFQTASENNGAFQSVPKTPHQSPCIYDRQQPKPKLHVVEFSLPSFCSIVVLTHALRTRLTPSFLKLYTYTQPQLQINIAPSTELFLSLHTSRYLQTSINQYKYSNQQSSQRF